MKTNDYSESCAVACSTPELLPRARELAASTGLPLHSHAGATPDALLLELTPERLQLRAPGPGAPGAVYVDFARLGFRRRHGSLKKEAIARAAGLQGAHSTSVVDATAGLGRDGFILASLGAEVTLIERSPVVAALLADGLTRAAEMPELAEVVERLRLVTGAGEQVLAALPPDSCPEVVYLDPMYPEEGTRAQVKKEMQLLRRLLGADPDPAGLLAAALTAARRRVVVKRPLKAPPVSGRRPNHSVPGRSTRFDVYLSGH